MAKFKLNPALEQLRGKIGNLVFRHVKGTLVISSPPNFKNRVLSQGQKKMNRRFSDAVAQAKSIIADPKRKAAYQAKAASDPRPLFAIVVSDCMRSSAD